MAAGMFPVNGVAAGSANNAYTNVVAAVAGCVIAWYPSNKCNVRIDADSLNGIMARLLAFIDGAKIAYDCSSSTQLVDASRRLALVSRSEIIPAPGAWPPATFYGDFLNDDTVATANLLYWDKDSAAYVDTGIGGGAGGLTDGDYGDIIVAGGGLTMAIDANAVTDTHLADMPAYSFKFNNTAAVGDPQNINATALTADAAPALTRLYMTFDPVTGEPKRSTGTEVKAMLGGGGGSLSGKAATNGTRFGDGFLLGTMGQLVGSDVWGYAEVSSAAAGAITMQISVDGMVTWIGGSSQVSIGRTTASFQHLLPANTFDFHDAHQGGSLLVSRPYVATTQVHARLVHASGVIQRSGAVAVAPLA